MYLVPTFHHLIRSFTGVSESKKFNAGLILEYRSNTFGNQSATSPLSFNNEIGKSRTGLSHIALQLRLHHLVHYPIFLCKVLYLFRY
jgi:hypothetical protein